jgi:hypothetical protein
MIAGGLTAFQVLRLQHVIQHRFYAVRKGAAFRVGIEAAGALGVERLRGSGAVAPLARRSVDPDVPDLIVRRRPVAFCREACAQGSYNGTRHDRGFGRDTSRRGRQCGEILPTHRTNAVSRGHIWRRSEDPHVVKSAGCRRLSIKPARDRLSPDSKPHAANLHQGKDDIAHPPAVGCLGVWDNCR